LLRQTHPIVDVGIVCSDFDKSLEFYHDKLGFEIVLDIEIPGDLATTVGLAPSGFRQVRLQAGSTLLKLMQIEAAPPTGSDEFKAGVRWLTYFVADINETVAALKAQGLPHQTYELSHALSLMLQHDDAEEAWLGGTDILAEATMDILHDDQDELFLDVLIAGARCKRLPENPWTD